MRIITLVEKYLLYIFLFLCLFIDVNQGFSQCPTVTNTNQSFCDTQSPTIASLIATDNGGGIKWYATSSSTTALSSSTVLINGENYFADDNTGSCGVRQSVVVTIYSAPTGANFQGVCVTSLSQAVITNPQFNISGVGLQWYTTPSGGTPISTSTILTDNTIYYISQTNPVTGCQTSRLSVFVNVGLVPVPSGDAVQEFCNTPGNAPTVANLVASGNNNWYLTSSFGIPLDLSTPLVNGQFYYATTVDPPCESSDRLQVLVNIYEPNDAGNNGNRSICIEQVPTTSPFDLFNLLGGTPDNTGVWSGPITTTNGSQGTLDVSTMTVSGSPYIFTYTVSSALCATDTSTVTITILPLPTATVSVSPTTICSGTSATVTFTGTPNATVTYTINSGANQTIVLNASGIATLSNSYIADTIISIVSVASLGSPSCVNPQTSSVTITALPLPTATVSVSPTTICFGTSATVTFTGTPNATVTYTINSGANQTIVLNASGTATLSNTYAVNTTITLVSVTTSGSPSCTKPLTQSVTITVIDPTATVSVSPTTICSGTSATVTFTGTPNATVTYTINSGANQTIVLNVSGTATLSNTYAVNTTITLVSVTTAGSPSCTKPLTQSVTITVIDPTATVSVSPTTICFGTSATVTFTGTPNATVTYTINSGANQTIVLNASGTATLSNTYAVNTTITLVSVTTAGSPSCTKPLTQSVTITVIDPTATVSVSPTTICSGTSATVTFTGTPNATVTYTINSGANQTIVLNASGTATLSNTYAVNTTITLVSVTTSGSPSCTKPLTQSVTITVIDPTATVSVSPTTICSGTSATVTFTGTPNATVTYTINSGANQTIVLNASGTATLSNTYAVNTTITLVSVTTAGSPSCTKPLTQSVTITVIDPTATVSVSPTTICFGTSATVTFTGTPNATVTYTINSGANQTIVLNASGTATLSNTYAVNTTITLVSVTTSGLPSCTKPLTQSVTITVIDPTATVSVSPTTICSGTSATVTFTGTPNATVTYTINSGANQTIVLNASGTATLSNTYAVNTTITLVSVTTAGSPSCTKPLTQSVTITVIDPTATVSVSPTTICSGTSATVTFTGTPNATVTYTINSGANQTIVLNASGTATLSNTYAVNTTITLVSVTTAGSPSCTKPLTQSVTITVIDPTATVSVSPTTICFGTSATVTFTGTPNATVTYTINSGANQTIVLNASGTATLSNTYAVNTTITLVSVTTAGSPSCTKPLTQSVTITVIDPTATVSVSPTTICSGTSATVTFTGTPNATVTYTINSGANQTIVLNASGTATLSNTYAVNTTITLVSVTTSGSPSCTKPLTQSVTITVIDPTATVSVSPTTICSGTSATVTFTGTPNATVTYTINSGANQTIVLNASGTATLSNTYAVNTTITLVSVTTAGSPSCTKPLTQSVTITVIDPTATVSVSPTTICFGTSATVTFTGTPNATVTYTINSGANQTIVLNASGTATLSNTYAVNTTITLVSVTTAGSPSCTKPLTQSVTITVIDPTATVSVSPTTICSGTSATVTFTGTPNATVTYTINSGANQTIVLNASGTATLSNTYAVNTTITLVSVTTAGSPSCTKPLTQSVTITVIDPTATVSVSPTTICFGTSATVTFTGTPNATVTYTINSGANQTIVLNASGTATLSNTYAVNTTITLVSVTTSGSPSCTKPLTQSVTITIVNPPIAGSNTSISLCVINPPVDLFSLLGSNAQSGGTWSPALASGTGVFNPAVDFSGTYTYTVIGATPCGNATATVQVTVNPVPDAGQSNTLSICSNQNSVDLFNSILGTPQTGGIWSPALASGTGIFNPAVDVSGIYTYTVTGIAPCSDATSTITVTVIPGPEAGTNNSIILCTNSPSQDLFLLLGVTAQPGGTWSPALASGTGVFNPAVDPQGNYTYVLSGTQPCDNDTAVISVTVNPVPDAGDNASVTICSNNLTQDLFLLLGPNAQSGGTWTPALASGTGVFNPTVDLAQTYTYSVGGGLCVTDTADVIVSITQAPNSGGVGQTLNECITATSVDLFTGLDGTQGSGTWNDDDATGALAGNIFNPSAIGAGTYHFTYTVVGTSPCTDATSTVTVIVNPLPNAGNNSTLTICSSDSSQDLFDLLGSSAETGGTWSPALASGTGVFDPVVDTSNIYTYTVSSTYCSSVSATVDVTVIQAANSGGVGQTLNACITANSVDLLTGLDGTQDSGTWNDDDTTGALTGNIFNPSAIAAGTYHFTYTVTGTSPCADATSTVTVIVNPLPNAGSNATLTVCSSDSAQDLFALLGSSAETGGTWSPALAGGASVFNPAVDTSNTYTYTISSSYCAAVSATVDVTVIPAANSGGIGQILNSCINITSLDLVTGLDGSQGSGTWNDDDSSGALTGNIFNPSTVGVGTYHFTYTVVGTSPCANASSTVTVVVNSLPNAGSFTGIVSLCPSTGVLDLASLLTGQNSGGTWTDISNQTVTSPLTIINFAPGTYTYTYTVNSVNNVCGSDTEQVQFTILANPQLATFNVTISPACLGSNVIVNLNGMTDGTYTLNYDLTGSNTLLGQTVTVTIASGIGNFTIPSASLPNVGTTVITFTSITNSTSTCTNTLVGVAKQIIVRPLADIDSTNLSATAVCFGNDVVVTITNAINLPDGVYQFNYSIPNATPTTGVTGNVTITGGIGQFTISASAFATAGNYTLTINGIVTTTGCTNSNENATVNIIINPIPSLTNASVSVQATCINYQSLVTISGASNLIDGVYTITYQLSGANTSSATVSVTFTGGVGTFTIPSTDLANAGDTVLTLDQIISTVSTCGQVGNVFSPITFTISSLGTPQLIQDGNLFCEANNPIIASLSANIVGFPTVVWYDAATGGTAYNDTDLLVNGATYYATLVAQSGCESGTRLQVIVDLTVCDDILIPDGFSPNNDGINDTFEINNLPILYPNFRLEIYNRYGNLVYKGNINTSNWDGTTNQGGLNLGNNLLPTGVYFYILDFRDGTRKAVQGRVYLNR